MLGPRLWVDLPGAPSRSRTIRGNGAIREVRVGRPTDNTTRLVLEFRPGTRLDPSQLRLVGTGPDRWQMELGGAVSGLRPFGEGDIDAPSVSAVPSWRANPPLVVSFRQARCPPWRDCPACRVVATRW